MLNKQQEINYLFKKCDSIKDQIYLLQAQYQSALGELEYLCRINNMCVSEG